MNTCDVAEAIKAALNEGGSVVLPPHGASMGPRFAGADGVAFIPSASATIGIGSVVAYERHGRWIVHRVLWISRSNGAAQYLTKGDAMHRWDIPWVSAGDVVGVAVELRCGSGAMKLAARNGPAWRERVRGAIELARAVAGRIVRAAGGAAM